MNAMSPSNASVFVPYQHKVNGVARIAPTNLNLDAPLNPYPKAERASKNQSSDQQAAPRRYSAQAAAPGFAAQILVEAGMTGDDPFAQKRCAKAYARTPFMSGQTRLTA
jgi:predicted TIM-barrel fold metal-dependent hydrolase